MQNENFKNIFFAMTLCIIILLAWQYYIIEPKLAQNQTSQPIDSSIVPSSPSTLTLPKHKNKNHKKTKIARVAIENSEINGSISLQGAYLDNIFLSQYKTSLAPTSGNVHLLIPQRSTTDPFWYTKHGWVTHGALAEHLPDENTIWTLEKGKKLTPQTPITLRYDNGQNLIFRRTISIDDHFMFTITQEVENKTSTDITLYPYGQIERTYYEEREQFFVLHEGGIGVFGNKIGLEEVQYSDLASEPIKHDATTGWLGLTDKYWATVLIPPQGKTYQGQLTSKDKRYIANYRLNAEHIAPGQTGRVVSRVFAGAKQIKLLEEYKTQNIPKFDLLIDWGWFFFFTKPLLYLLSFFYSLFGNFGVSILIVTVIIKIMIFPLANKSYVTMAKMKKLQPRMQQIKETYADNRVLQQQELMALYKKEKLNPIAGCLPMLIQIPLFFSLYKVLFVSINMRHQPFFGWIQDLSAPDPTSVFNLFGLLPFTPPSFLLIGVWPLLMGITMFIQMQMNPNTADPIQRKIFMFMPIAFTFLLASFPAGLVIYWAWNNFLSILQQGFIMHKQGVEIPFLSFFKRRK